MIPSRLVLVLVLGAAAPPAGAQEVAETIGRAEELLGQRRFGEVAALVEESGLLAAGDPGADYLYGFALINLLRFDEAEAALARAVAARPGRANWHHALAKARVEQGKNLAALEALERAIALDDDPRFRYARAMCALKLGDLALAQRELEATVAAVPGHADALYHLGKLAVDRGDYLEALSRLERALAAEPTHLEARYHSGVAELRSGRPEAAVTILEELVATAPGHGGALYNLGRALIAVGREEEGRRRLAEFEASEELREEIELLRRTLRLDPQNVDARLGLAARLLRGGRAGEAFEELTAARALAPRRSEIYLGLAAALERLGRVEEARRAAEHGRRLAEADPP